MLRNRFATISIFFTVGCSHSVGEPPSSGSQTAPPATVQQDTVSGYLHDLDRSAFVPAAGAKTLNEGPFERVVATNGSYTVNRLQFLAALAPSQERVLSAGHYGS